MSTPTDVVGCEVGGVVKNVIAIASGMAEGMGFGDNTRATLITRRLAELSRLGVAMGGDPLTFAGLPGTGVLIATCSSHQSRNNSVGRALGEGKTIEEILDSMNMVAEGVKSSPSVLELAHRYGVEMPITEQVVAVCHEGTTARDAVATLITRPSTSELEALDDRHRSHRLGLARLDRRLGSPRAVGRRHRATRLVGRRRRPLARAFRGSQRSSGSPRGHAGHRDERSGAER